MTFKKQMVAVFHSGGSEPNLEGAGASYLSFTGTEYAFGNVLVEH